MSYCIVTTLQDTKVVCVFCFKVRQIKYEKGKILSLKRGENVK
jgi:hypothetical protein